MLRKEAVTEALEQKAKMLWHSLLLQGVRNYEVGIILNGIV